MYDRLKTLYFAGKLSQEELHKAVDKGWITEVQYEQILAGYDPATPEDYNDALDELGV